MFAIKITILKFGNEASFPQKVTNKSIFVIQINEYRISMQVF